MDSLIAGAMSAILEHPDLKEGIRDYLAALTEAAKPTEPVRWRKVWEAVSQETRSYLYSELAAQFGMPAQTYRLYVLAMFNEADKIGRVMVDIVPEDFDFKDRRRFDGAPHIQWEEYDKLLYDHLMNAEHYTDVIIKAQACLPEALALWDQYIEERSSVANSASINVEAFKRP